MVSRRKLLQLLSCTPLLAMGLPGPTPDPPDPPKPKPKPEPPKDPPKDQEDWWMVIDVHYSDSPLFYRQIVLWEDGVKMVLSLSERVGKDIHSFSWRRLWC